MPTNINFDKSLGLQGNTSITIKKASCTDPDSTAFLLAAGITDPTISNAICNLVVGLKADGLWSKMKAIYPFVGGTATTHKYNLKDPRDLDAAFRLVFNGGWTHSSTGALPNGTNGYANTNLNQSANLAPSNNHICFYSRTSLSSAINQIDTGVTNNTSYSFSNLAIGKFSSLSFENGSQTPSGTFTNTLGLFLGSSISSTSGKLYKNGSSIASSTTAQTRTMFNNNIFLGTSNVSTTNLPVNVFWSSKQYAFSSIGDGLTDTEATNLYTRVQAFQTSLNRQVP